MDSENADNRELSQDAGALVISKEGMSLVPPKASSFFVDDPDLAQWVEEEITNSGTIHFESELGFEGITNILSYLMYAMERADWKEEFVDELESAYEEQNKQTPPEKKIPPYLKVVK